MSSSRRLRLKFKVLNGEYPFDQVLGSVEAETEEEALTHALREFRSKEHPHPVVEVDHEQVH